MLHHPLGLSDAAAAGTSLSSQLPGVSSVGVHTQTRLATLFPRLLVVGAIARREESYVSDSSFLPHLLFVELYGR